MRIILRKNCGGIVYHVVVILILFLAVYLFNLASSLNQERSQFQEYTRSKKSYYMAKSGIEHFMLKFKTFLRRYPETIEIIRKLPKNKKNVYNSFKEDVIIPPDNALSGRFYKYGIKEFDILDNNDKLFTLEIESYGNYDNSETNIKRYVTIDR